MGRWFWVISFGLCVVSCSQVNDRPTVSLNGYGYRDGLDSVFAQIAETLDVKIDYNLVDITSYPESIDKYYYNQNYILYDSLKGYRKGIDLIIVRGDGTGLLGFTPSQDTLLINNYPKIYNKVFIAEVTAETILHEIGHLAGLKHVFDMSEDEKKAIGIISNKDYIRNIMQYSECAYELTEVQREAIRRHLIRYGM